MFGILLIDKPLGLTSHDVVNRLRRKFNTKRVGHAGTLDPLATGLLVVAIGPATRFLQYLPLEPKEYVCEITFGRETNTQDAEGEIVAEKSVPQDLEARLYDVIPNFLGLIEQVPPMYSAVKKNGQPLYVYARQGKEVERDSRQVHLDLVDVMSLENNVMKARVVCSGGTYMRTLAHDIGQQVGCGAYLSGLVRTKAGKFELENAVTFDDVEPSHIVPLASALPPMKLVDLNSVQVAAIRQGQRIGFRGAESEKFVGLKDEKGDVFGVAQVMGPMLQPECVIPIEAVSV